MDSWHSSIDSMDAFNSLFDLWCLLGVFDADLSVDVIDSSGEHQFGVEHNVFKRRLDLEGNPLQEAELDTINKNHNRTEEAK